jgi:hypothetical protein
MKKEIFLLLQIFILMIYFIILNDFGLSKSLEPKLIQNNLYSHTFIVNNNLAQYSSYITKNENGYLIEIYFFMNLVQVVNGGLIETYSCLLQWLNQNGTENIIKVKAISSSPYYFENNRMVKFEITNRDIRRYLHLNFKIENVQVAIIRKDDYDTNLSENELNKRLEFVDTFNFTKIALPYSLIKYQKPIFFDGRINITKTIAACIPYSYGSTLPNIENWIDFHLKFGMEEIMFYDSTTTELIKSLLNSDKYKNEKRLKVKPYRISYNDVCSLEGLAQSSFIKVDEILQTNCKHFFNREFKEFIAGRTKHEQITSNDCLTQMSKTHEFVSNYDLDEFVFPRTRNITATPEFSCDDKKSVCSVKPFEWSNNTYYSYLDTLIEKYKKGRERDKLTTIYFEHAAYLVHNEQVEKIFNNLSSIITSSYKSSNKYPIILTLGQAPKTHAFVVEEKDLEYVKYLYNGYQNVSKCLFKSVNSSLNSSFQRFVYFRTEHDQRWPKCIHYTKNVYSVFAHYPKHVNYGEWRFTPSYKDGDMLAHFRDDMYWLNGKFKSSIRNLNIDFEYLIFMSQQGNCKV